MFTSSRILKDALKPPTRFTDHVSLSSSMQAPTYVRSNNNNDKVIKKKKNFFFFHVFSTEMESMQNRTHPSSSEDRQGFCRCPQRTRQMAACPLHPTLPANSAEGVIELNVIVLNVLDSPVVKTVFPALSLSIETIQSPLSLSAPIIAESMYSASIESTPPGTSSVDSTPVTSTYSVLTTPNSLTSMVYTSNVASPVTVTGTPAASTPVHKERFTQHDEERTEDVQHTPTRSRSQSLAATSPTQPTAPAATASDDSSVISPRERSATLPSGAIVPGDGEDEDGSSSGASQDGPKMSAVATLKATARRKRRLSIAVWSDPRLLELSQGGATYTKIIVIVLNINSK